jgi:hypothetical protein
MPAPRQELVQSLAKNGDNTAIRRRYLVREFRMRIAPEREQTKNNWEIGENICQRDNSRVS